MNDKFSPSAGSPVADLIPSFHKKDDNTSITVTHTEFVGDLRGTGLDNFVRTDYEINPGLANSFPFLSQIACNFEEYQIKQLAYMYRSVVSDIGSSTTGQTGTVVMATNYRPSNAPFRTKFEMMQYDGAVSSRTTQSQYHFVECDPKKLARDQIMYVRSIDVSDKNDFDHGRLSVALCDVPAAYGDNTVGELWVSYSVVLSKPKQGVNAGKLIQRDTFINRTSTGFTNQAGSLFPPIADVTTVTKATRNNIGTVLSNVTVPTLGGATRITFPRNKDGIWRIRGRCTFASLSAAGQALSTVQISPNSGSISVIDKVITINNTPAALDEGEELSTAGSYYVADIQWDVTVRVVTTQTSKAYVDVGVFSPTLIAANSFSITHGSIDIDQVNPDFYSDTDKLIVTNPNGIVATL